MNETLVFYPHWCFDCMYSFVGSKESEPCPRCGSENVVNYKRELYKNRVPGTPNPPRSKNECG